MVQALITGGTGFVGSHIARQLVAEGHQVRVLHRTTSKLDALEGVDYESAIGDLNDIEAIKSACEGCEWVFHVAAVADYWRADKSRMFEANVDGTRRVLQSAREAGVKRVIFTSSAAAIGVSPNQQVSDESVDFNLPTKFFPYGYSKHLAEGVVAEAVAQGQDVVTVNPVVIMGPGDLNMISGTFITQIKQFRGIVPVTNGGVGVTDVRDVARWHVRVAEVGKTGERYILGSANYTYREWFGMIAETVDTRKLFIPTPNFLAPITARGIDLLRKVGIKTPIDSTQARMGTQYIYFAYDKAWEALGAPQIDMRQSLEDTYQWYKAHGYL